MDRAALLAAIFALQATAGFFHYVRRQMSSPPRSAGTFTDSVRTGAAFRFVGIRLLSVFQL